MLEDKSLTELRIIAQGLGVKDIFSKSFLHLRREIEQKGSELIPQQEQVVAPVIEIKVDNSVNTLTEELLMDNLKPFLDKGMRISIANGLWKFSFGKKVDTGTMSMPLRTAIRKAQEILS